MGSDLNLIYYLMTLLNSNTFVENSCGIFTCKIILIFNPEQFIVEHQIHFFEIGHFEDK